MNTQTKTSWRNLQHILAAIALVGSSGCVSWHSGTVSPDMRRETTVTGARTKVELAVDFQVVGAPATPQATQKAIDMISGLGKEALEKTGRYQVTTGGQGDYVLKLDIRDGGNPNIALAVLSGITLTVLPAYAADDYSIDVQLRTKDGRPLGTHHIQEKLAMFMELLMVFGMPFANPWSVSKEMWADVFSDVGAWSDATLAGQPRAPGAVAAVSGS